MDLGKGKGKGAPEYFVAVVKPGRIMFEIDGVSYDIAKAALNEICSLFDLSIISHFI